MHCIESSDTIVFTMVFAMLTDQHGKGSTNTSMNTQSFSCIDAQYIEFVYYHTLSIKFYLASITTGK